MTYSNYIESRTKTIKACLSELGCQPIVFAGAGLTKRYLQGPSWQELLEAISEINPRVSDKIAFLYQKYGNFLDVGEHLIPFFHEWAWSDGRDFFDESLFSTTTPASDFIKYFIAKYIGENVRFNTEDIEFHRFKDELNKLQGIRPHSIITTNYDTVCEAIFPEFQPIIGEKIIRASNLSIGEIFKIHGCITDPREIIITTRDYNNWTSKKKYLAAKLLTYFLEHPVLIVGYGVQDPNVLSILRDIDEILASPGALVPNIFYLVYDDSIDANSSPASDMILDLGDGKSMRINAIYASDFSWVFQAFEANSSLENVSPKLLRALMARTYDLVRHDIPRMKMQVDFATLEQVVASEEILPKLLGITGLADPGMFNAMYPYTLTAVATKLGYNTWHGADKLHSKIIAEKGISLKDTDNKYHIKVKSGDKSHFSKYSESFVELLRVVKECQPYKIIV